MRASGQGRRGKARQLFPGGDDSQKENDASVANVEETLNDGVEKENPNNGHHNDELSEEEEEEQKEEDTPASKRQRVDNQSDLSQPMLDAVSQ